MTQRYTDLTLSQQLRITNREIQLRLEFLDFTPKDAAVLLACKPIIAEGVDELVEEFYRQQVDIEEVSRLIGDAESLARLKGHMRRYVLGLFDGQYDTTYVQSRLRIGLVHKRIGVSPKLYTSAIRRLNALLGRRLQEDAGGQCQDCRTRLAALDKILLFDLTLVFDTYIHSLMEELVKGKDEIERYAESLEETVAERTRQLAEMARRDGLTGLVNQATMREELRKELARSQRRGLSLSFLYLDVDKFKTLNDTQGHQRGDELLKALAQAMRQVLRAEDIPVRYGGDEFCAILPQTSSDEAVKAAKRLQEEFARQAGQAAGVTLSVGLATTGPEVFLEAEELVKAADAAMYRAKERTGDTLEVVEAS